MTSHSPRSYPESPMLSVPAPVVAAAPPRQQTVFWVIAVLLAVIATALVMRLDDRLASRLAMAQTAGVPAGARGIYAFTGQLTSKTYGLFMIDVDTGTVWCYEMLRGPNGEPQMVLVAARSWIFDRYLEEFNVGEPIPSAVQAMVRQQRGQREQAMTPPVPAPDTSAPE
jgi:hypothetical protein